MQLSFLQKYHTAALEKIRKALDDRVMFVGGAVRDAILAKATKDIDLTTSFTPDEVMKKLQESGLKPLPLGIEQGMVAVAEKSTGLTFEITTLREDVLPMGRKAVVKFGTDYVADALRRDFTINALYADMDGNVSDFIGGCMQDIAEKKIVFIGNPEQRIKEDALRILRFFRFFTVYGGEKPDESALCAIKNNIGLLKKISKERITDELFKILNEEDGLRIIKTFTLMKKSGLLAAIYPDFDDIKGLTAVLEQEKKYDLPKDKIVRFASLLKVTDKASADNIKRVFRLSNKQTLVLCQKINADGIVALLETNPDEAIYRHLKEEIIAAVLLTKKPKKITDLKKILTLTVPQFPLKGLDIAALGYQGQKIGKILQEKEDAWLKSNFKLSKKQLLEIPTKTS